MAKGFAGGIFGGAVGFRYTADGGFFEIDNAKIHFLCSFDYNMKGNRRTDCQCPAASCFGWCDPVLPDKGAGERIGAVITVFGSDINDPFSSPLQLTGSFGEASATDIAGQ